MDFTPRSNHSVSSSQPAAQGTSSKNSRKWLSSFRVAWVVLLFCGTILFVAVVAFLGINRVQSYQEGRFVDTTKYQAVFLSGQQLPYFAKITTMNSKYVVIEDIYYLSIPQAVQPDAKAQTDPPKLIKLGCELHGPEDRMVINREQVTFWENLKDDGKVAVAVKDFKAKYPEGLKCETTEKKQ